MKLLVLGATGATGLQVVRQALDLGHEVTAFVRDRAKLSVAASGLEVVTGALPDSEQTLAGERVVRASGLDWTFLYPTLLTDGPRTGRYRAGERLELRGMPRISRADVADFALRILSDRAWSGKIAVLSD